MASRDLRDDLKRAADELARVAVPRSLQGALPQRPAPRQLALVPTAVAGLAVAAAVAGLVSTLLPIRHLGGFTVAHTADDFDARLDDDGFVHVEEGRADFIDLDEGLTLSVREGAVFKRERPGVRIAAGFIDVDVVHREAAAPPVKVWVSHGVIAVLGTQFEVTQRELSGVVYLTRGSIEFTSYDGRNRRLVPTELLEWPLPAEASAEVKPEDPEPPPLPPESPPVPRPPKPKRPLKVEPAPIQYANADDLLRQVDVLRSRGELEEAVRYLTHGLTRELKGDTRERLSFELGVILTDRIADGRRACAQWKRHRAEFKQGRYDVEVSRAAVRAKCEGVE